MTIAHGQSPDDLDTSDEPDEPDDQQPDAPDLIPSFGEPTDVDNGSADPSRPLPPPHDDTVTQPGGYPMGSADSAAGREAGG
jgi:hypothetical protein